jgi:tRNA(fMet)-specific endonuclease VapC
MTLYLLDTTTFSLLMQEDPKVRARLMKLTSEDQLIICAIVRGEIRYGLERLPRGRRRRDLEAKADNLFAVLPCEPVPEAAADAYARIKRETERKGMPLDENDLWIAATARALGAVLVTSDSDFQRIRGLSVEDWTQ